MQILTVTRSEENNVKKRQDIELLRILSAFAIVWFHSEVIGYETAYAGLIVFLILSMYLAGKSTFSGNHRISRRVARLLIPWAVWFIIYGLLNVLAHKSIIPLNHGILAGILSGPRIHLWYIPFIFICLTLFDIVRNYVSNMSIACISAILAIIVLSSAAVWRFESIQLGYPIAQYAHASAGVFIGVFFSYFGVIPKRIGTLLLLIIVVAAASAIPCNGVGIPYLIGIAAGCVVVFQPLAKKSIINLSFISQCTLGIYFIHIIFLLAIKKLNADTGILLPIVAFILSFFTIFLIRRLFPKLAKYAT